MDEEKYRSAFISGFANRAEELGFEKQAFVGTLASIALPIVADAWAQSKIVNLLGRGATLAKAKSLQPLLSKSNMARQAVDKVQAGSGKLHNLLTQSPMISSSMGDNLKGQAAFMGVNYLTNKLTSPIVQPIAERFARKDIPKEYRNQI